MKLQLQVSKENFYSKYYQTINGILKLTNKELAILVLLSNSKQLGTTDKELFSSNSRKLIAETLSISKFNLNNYIKSMKDRGIIIKQEKSLAINPAVYKDISNTNLIDLIFTFNIIHEATTK